MKRTTFLNTEWQLRSKIEGYYRGLRHIRLCAGTNPMWYNHIHYDLYRHRLNTELLYSTLDPISL